ncbi:cilia- and flagella-associated protein 221 [Antennarius striatus]|uniref:cilia- and flagella-associated protein 221 n=1 Tax=Antennarius striatus TaxID=241820 RepID=UPI0035B4BDE0
MEVALSAPPPLSEPLRRGAPLPLIQLVEESRNRADAPNRLLESKIYAKLKSNSLIEAEPSELHFTGFQLGKNYTKILKLINVSSEVMNIHIIPTQTRHFQTSYTKKYRLIPGLAYTLKVGFRPDEWRYFYDCIRVHCKGDENLFIPVHAYPVIDDLRIPPLIDLSAVPLGQSVHHAIPLRCSCPVDFEFQVHIIQPHEAFSIHPLTGVIPANGDVQVIVTFTPLQYETSQVTFQLSVSQFNSKPYLCTVTGSSAPHLALRALGRDAASAEYKRPPLPPANRVPRSKTKYRTTKEAEKLKTARYQTSVQPGPNICTHAGVAKILMSDTNKLRSRDLKDSVSRGGAADPPNRKMKEALFKKRVQQNVKEEQNNRIRWQVRRGQDPMSDRSRRRVAEEREMALHEYKVKKGEVKNEEKFVAGPPKLSSERLLRDAGEACEGTPSFQIYSSFNWELKKRALKLFQQAARKVVIRCRMNRRLARLKTPHSEKHQPSSDRAGEEMTDDLKISPDRVSPFTFPVFSDEDNPLVLGNFTPLPVDPIEVTVTTDVPLFKLQVPQQYKLKGYKPVSTWEAFSSYIPTTLARPLRTGSPDEPVSEEKIVLPLLREEPQTSEDHQGRGAKAKEAPSLTFAAPAALHLPIPANPLRIFNPAPGLQAYKPTPKYLESDPEFHLCPLPRYTIPEGSGNTTHTQKRFQSRKEVIPGLMTWKNFDLMASISLNNHPTPTRDSIILRSNNYSTDLLPLAAPSPLDAPSDDAASLKDEPCESSGVQLTPAMIRAQFLCGEAPVSPNDLTRGMTARRRGELHTDESESNQMGKRVMGRLKRLEATDRVLHSPADDEE